MITLLHIVIIKNILSEAQHVFKNKHSTITNLIELLNGITKQLDSINNVGLITIDFFKALDNISHNKHIYKLLIFGIGGKTLFWVKEFLNKCTFSACINSAHSELFSVDSSVPQGTKLGPLIYILFVNDIVKLFKFFKIKMYAVDIILYAVVNTHADKIAVQMN